MNLKNLTYILIVYTLIITSILLFLRKKKHISISLLGAYSAFQVICVGSYFLYVKFDYIFNNFPQLLFFPRPFLFIIIPLFYLYIKTSVYPELRFTKKWVYHFSPFILFTTYYLFLYWIKQGDKLRHLFQYNNSHLFKEFVVTNVLFNIQYLVYCILLMRILRKVILNKQKLLHTVFNQHLLKATIFMYVAGCALSWGTNAIVFFKINVGFDILFLNSLYFYFFFLYLFYITVKGYNTKEIFKYSSSEGNNEDLKILYNQIINDITSRRPFLEPTITLKEYAESIDLDLRKVSQAINLYFGSNFNDFMNFYRIELSKKMLLEKPELNIQEVMYESGFNSKATFNKVFKEFTRSTPTDFRKIQNNKN